MGRFGLCVAGAGLGLLLAAATLNGGDVLTVRVSPQLSVAPGFMTVRVILEPSADNRVLEVVAESADYYRRSEVALDGTAASRLNVFEFRELPPGFYEVTTTLVSAHGQRTAANSLARVAPAPGR